MQAGSLHRATSTIHARACIHTCVPPQTALSPVCHHGPPSSLLSRPGPAPTSKRRVLRERSKSSATWVPYGAPHRRSGCRSPALAAACAAGPANKKKHAQVRRRHNCKTGDSSAVCGMLCQCNSCPGKVAGIHHPPRREHSPCAPSSLGLALSPMLLYELPTARAKSSTAGGSMPCCLGARPASARLCRVQWGQYWVGRGCGKGRGAGKTAVRGGNELAGRAQRHSR